MSGSHVTALNYGDFDPDRKTTHGIEVSITPQQLPHPDCEHTIGVNYWDFGGQDLYKVIHQFFFSSRSLYVVVWHPRRGADNSRVADWIALIQRRVGDGFRALIVASHRDEGRYPRIDEHGLTQQFPGVIAGFYEIDSESGSGIPELRDAIAQEAAGLPQMGEPFPVSWREVRDDIQRSKSPKLDWKAFEKKCRQYEVARGSDKVLAGLLDALGHIIYFGDDPSLADLVVLKPEWLSKAIGLVLEDRPTIEANGILDHSRLAEIWNDNKRKPRDRYKQEKLYPFFLRLMEKFDVSYRIPDSNDQTSLVGELVQKVRPGVEGSSIENEDERTLPWDHDHEPRESWHRLQLIVRLDDDPPGLVPWLIVRNHRYNDARIHWRDGVFLESDYGQALIELRDRELFLTVHGSYPSTFRGIMQSSIEELLKTWEGLKGRWHLRVPCRTVHENGKRCEGTLLLTTLQKFQSRSISLYPCEKCAEEQDIGELVIGFSSPEPNERVREGKRKLDEIAACVHAGFAEAKDDRRKMADDMLDRFRAMSAESARLILKALENRQSPCPRVFTLLPATLDGWEKVNPAEWLGKATKKRFRLSLWCEMPGEEHPTCAIGSAGSTSKPKDGEYVFSRAQEWFSTVARYTSLIGKVLGVVAPVAKNASQLIGGDDDGLAEVLKQIDVMKTLGDAAKQLQAEGNSDRHEAHDARHEPFREIVEGSEHRVFHRLLRELDENEHYGGLKWTLDKASGDWLWLYPQHFKIFNPDLPKLPPSRPVSESAT